MLDIKPRFSFQPPADHAGAVFANRLAILFGKQ
jgi:hypothetical protein